MLGTQIYPQGPIIVPKAPIYKLALFRMKEAYLDLPEAEQLKWNERMETSYQETGTQVICFAKSSWCDEQWQGWCIEAYPSLEALQTRADFMEESGWYRYVQAISALGVRYPLEP